MNAMTEKNLSLGLLVKLMGKTTSDNDNECMMAIRKANEHIKHAGKTWQEILTEHITVIGDPFGDDLPVTAPKRRAEPPPPPPPPAPHYSHALGPNFCRACNISITDPSIRYACATPFARAGQIRTPTQCQGACASCGRAQPVGSGHDIADGSGNWKLWCTACAQNAGHVARPPRMYGLTKSEKSDIDDAIFKMSMRSIASYDQQFLNSVMQEWTTKGQITQSDYNRLMRLAGKRSKKLGS